MTRIQEREKANEAQQALMEEREKASEAQRALMEETENASAAQRALQEKEEKMKSMEDGARVRHQNKQASNISVFGIYLAQMPQMQKLVATPEFGKRAE
mmetsp:Transcript_136630/g.248490  ORF Transcript_136630/g.248490 Transcript_136630/m.248490 type:complete len:99 (+) Transcript_136630:84-380(+)